jgi:hypothetical protein
VNHAALVRAKSAGTVVNFTLAASHTRGSGDGGGKGANRGERPDVRGGGRGYQNGGPLLANLSPRLSLFIYHLRTVLAVKGSLRRAQQRRALDRSGPFGTTSPDKRERLPLNGPPGRGPLRRHFGTLFRRHRHPEGTRGSGTGRSSRATGSDCAGARNARTESRPRGRGAGGMARDLGGAIQRPPVRKEKHELTVGGTARARCVACHQALPMAPELSTLS